VDGSDERKFNKIHVLQIKLHTRMYVEGEKGEALRVFVVEIKWELVMNAFIVYDLQELFRFV
jgi:hypothetical protein